MAEPHPGATLYNTVINHGLDCHSDHSLLPDDWIHDSTWCDSFEINGTCGTSHSRKQFSLKHYWSEGYSGCTKGPLTFGGVQ